VGIGGGRSREATQRVLAGRMRGLQQRAMGWIIVVAAARLQNWAWAIGDLETKGPGDNTRAKCLLLNW
jgi:hypothetical protein